MLFALTAGLLAIACSNVAGMLLARAAARRREMATRLAVGASRGQLLRHLLAEVLVLFAAAGAIAIPIAAVLGAGLRTFLPVLPVPINFDLEITTRTILFSGGTALISALSFGLTPARHALGTNLSELLHGQSSTPPRRRLRLRHGLVVLQLALSLAMVGTSGLFVRTLLAAATIDPGFQTANVEVVSIDTSLAGVPTTRAVSLVNRIEERLRGIEGVEAVGHSRLLPLQGASLALGLDPRGRPE